MNTQDFANFEAIFNAISDQLVIIDRDFKIVKINGVFEEILGLKSHKLLGRNCYEIIHGRREPLPNCSHQQAIAWGRSLTEEFWEPYLEKFLHLIVSPIYNEAKQLIGTIHILKDLTEHKQTQEKILRANRLYAVLSKINEIIIRVRDKQETWWPALRGSIWWSW